MTTTQFEIQPTEHSRLSTFDFSNIPFGKNFSDHMLVAEYADGEWKKVVIKPYGNLELPPSTTCFHYAQAVFEGMKANRGNDGSVLLFRPEENWKRINTSANRISMPEIPHDIFMNGLFELIKLDRKWMPKADGTSLYIRPFMIGTEPFIGVKTPDRFMFIIITSPVGAYYSEDVSVYVDEEHARAVKGVGAAKFAGNYAASLQPVEEARKKGFKDVLWLDAEGHRYIQEVGTMNIFFVVGDTIITPELDGGFLPGITRDSIIQLARHLGYKVEVRPIDIQEIADAHKAGQLKEVFGTGTAAVVTLVNKIGYRDEIMQLDSSTYKVSLHLKENLVNIQKGKIEDPFGWVVKVCDGE